MQSPLLEGTVGPPAPHQHGPEPAKGAGRASECRERLQDAYHLNNQVGNQVKEQHTAMPRDYAGVPAYRCVRAPENYSKARITLAVAAINQMRERLHSSQQRDKSKGLLRTDGHATCQRIY